MCGLVGCLASLAFATDVLGDAVELSSGERLTGRVTQVTIDTVVLEAEGRTISLERGRVRAIFLTPAPNVAAPPASSSEALAALKRLRAVTTSSTLELRSYTASLTQSREPIEKYVKQSAADVPLKALVSDALDLYDFAAAVWESRLTNSATASAVIGRSPIIERCPALQTIVSRYPPPTSQENAWRRGVSVEFEMPAIWSCAAEKVAEIERLSSR
jgi:hypothetical protein